jgi:long-chain fatty acid transport protein
MTMRLKLLSLSVLAMGGASSLLSGHAQASGYNFGSQSVSAQGTAHANAAEAADPTTIYYNPAGMSLLDGDQISVGVTGVFPSSSFTNNGSVNALGHATTGTDGGRYAPSAVVAPTLYLSHQVNDTVNIGLGIFVPYGAKLNYGTNWVGRYALESINLQTLNFNPSISFKLDERQSIGFGISAQYMKADLQKAVDTSTLLYLAGLNNTDAALPDGQAKFSADGWGYGFNLGYMFKLDDHTRFGLAYRSEIHQTLKGNATWEFSGLSGSQQDGVNSDFHNSSAQTKVVTPQSASASFYHDLTDKLAVMGDATWTGHSSMQNIDIQFTGTSEGDLRINQNWKNSWLFALGANYKYNDSLLLRTGVAYDQTPVPNDQLRDPALPDADRYWLSLGANYKFSKQSSVDLSYSYVFFKTVNTDYADVCSGQQSCTYTGNGETTKGSYKTNLQLVGVQYNYRF